MAAEWLMLALPSLMHVNRAEMIMHCSSDTAYILYFYFLDKKYCQTTACGFVMELYIN